MLRARCLASCAALLIAAQLPAAAGPSAAEEAFQPGPENNPESCRQFWDGVGLPERKNTNEENFTTVCHLGYITGHNNERKTPDWVVEHLTFAQASGTAAREGKKFQPEPNVPGASQATLDDYKKSHFDQGHQAPAADFKSSKQLLDDTFFLSNAVPQVGIGFNQSVWRELEDHIQDLVTATGPRGSRGRPEFFVMTGPIYQAASPQLVRKTADACRHEVRLPVLPKQSICPGNRDNPNVRCDAGVAIPAGLYKIIFDPKLGRVNAFLMPNIDHTPLKGKRRIVDYLEDFRVSVSSVEALTGLKFFTALPPRTQRMLRENCPPTMIH